MFRDIIFPLSNETLVCHSFFIVFIPFISQHHYSMFRINDSFKNGLISLNIMIYNSFHYKCQNFLHFSRLNSIPLCIYTIFSFPIYSSMSTSVDYIFWLVWIGSMDMTTQLYFLYGGFIFFGCVYVYIQKWEGWVIWYIYWFID